MAFDGLWTSICVAWQYHEKSTSSTKLAEGGQVEKAPGGKYQCNNTHFCFCNQARKLSQTYLSFCKDFVPDLPKFCSVDSSKKGPLLIFFDIPFPSFLCAKKILSILIYGQVVTLYFLVFKNGQSSWKMAKNRRLPCRYKVNRSNYDKKSPSTLPFHAK